MVERRCNYDIRLESISPARNRQYSSNPSPDDGPTTKNFCRREPRRRRTLKFARVRVSSDKPWRFNKKREPVDELAPGSRVHHKRRLEAVDASESTTERVRRGRVAAA